MRDNEKDRYGSARYATSKEIAAAGLFDQESHSIFLGFFQGRAVYYSGPGSMTVTAGARAGKMRDWRAYNILTGTCLQTIVMLDPKGEGAYLSQDQTADGKFCAYWNPAWLHDLPQDACNPLDFLTLDSPTLVSDMKLLWESLIPNSGSASGSYFEGRARTYGETTSLTCVKLGGALTFPDLFQAVNLIPIGGDAWLDFAYAMHVSGFHMAVSVEAEIFSGRRKPEGGFQGIMGELLRSISCLSDPILMASVSRPYSFSMADTVAGDQAWQIYLMPPWGVPLKLGTGDQDHLHSRHDLQIPRTVGPAPDLVHG